MIKPEELSSAPSPALDSRFALSILKEAIDEPNTVQWVLTRSLISKGTVWFKEMAGKLSSLCMTDQEIGSYVLGFLLPLLSLQAAKISIDVGKETYLESVRGQKPNPNFTFILQNLEDLIRLLKNDPSGMALTRAIVDTGAKDMPDHYFVKGLKLAADTYESYMSFFFNYRQTVDLW